MVDRPFTERYGADTERYPFDSGLEEGEVGQREEGESRGGGREAMGGEREGGERGGP